MDGNQVIHSCATRQGSSGSLIWSLEGEVVGLHAWGGGMLGGRQINRAVRITALAKDSATLRGLIPPAPKPVVQSGDCAKVQVPEGFYCERDADGGLRILSELPEELEKLRMQCSSQAAWACTNLGYAFSKGEGIDQNDEQAATYYAKSCTAGSAMGCNNLGILVAKGRGVPQDHARAANLFKRSCDGGQVDGCFSYGYALQFGRGVQKDVVQASRLYQRACEGNIVGACFNLALNYQSGDGVAADSDRAKTLFKKACDGGLSRACELLK